jgi:hypothetical protein
MSHSASELRRPSDRRFSYPLHYFSNNYTYNIPRNTLHQNDKKIERATPLTSAGSGVTGYYPAVIYR